VNHFSVSGLTSPRSSYWSDFSALSSLSALICSLTSLGINKSFLTSSSSCSYSLFLLTHRNSSQVASSKLSRSSKTPQSCQLHPPTWAPSSHSCWPWPYSSSASSFRLARCLLNMIVSPVSTLLFSLPNGLVLRLMLVTRSVGSHTTIV
jgi:hypothetical protein